MSKFTVLVAMHNTLTALGVKHILEKSFEVIAHCRRPEELAQAITIDPDYVVVDESVSESMTSLLMPLKERMIVVGETAVNGLKAVDCRADESDIIDRFNEIFEPKRTPAKQQVLSSREIEVLTLVAQGYINKQIADRLNISVNTVLTHRKNITAKLGIKSVAGLSVYALMNGIIKDSIY